MNMVTGGALGLVLAIGGCVADSPDPTPGGTCNASQWGSLIGGPAASAEVVPEPRRTIPPNSMVTQDYSEQRTNIDLDSDGNITRIWCG